MEITAVKICWNCC